VEELKIGCFIRNENGRDAGRVYAVISTDGQYLTLADGRSRRLEKPKRKKHKHVSLVSGGDEWLTQRLLSGERITNAQLRRALGEIPGKPGMEEVSTLGKG
jgi:hypothetical protein